MPNWKFWKRPSQDRAAEAPAATPEIAPRARGFAPPEPRIDQRVDAGEDARLARLYRRREEALADLTQAELAATPENPWTERIATIDAALSSIDADLQRPRAVSGGMPQIPPAPVANLLVAPDGGTVTFTLGGEPFRYEEEIDWAERGTNVWHGDLVRAAGDLHRVPDVDPKNAETTAALERALFAFASEARNASEAGRPLPAPATLADIASPCPVCGGIRDLRGTCPRCEAEGFRRAELVAERQRLADQRDAEIVEQAKLADRIPVARRRLQAIEAEIAQAP